MEPIDCACVIHGDLYSFDYVEKLYSMLARHLGSSFKFHVFTEQHRSVPRHMIKHALTPWPAVEGKRSGWWYKMQLFDPAADLGQTLYLDLDVVIVKSLDWVLQLAPKYFWTIRDFKYLWRANHSGLNSSLMYWNQPRFSKIWLDFQRRGITDIRQRYRGDQDYLTDVIDTKDLRFVGDEKVCSWRWQVWDGGLDIKKRQCRNPGSGVTIDQRSSVVIFHGSPKPHEVKCDFIDTHWS